METQRINTAFENIHKYETKFWQLKKLKLLNMHKRFKTIILKCQRLRNEFGLYYEERCQLWIQKYSTEITEKGLVEKCQDVDEAKQFCIMNCLTYNTSKEYV